MEPEERQSGREGRDEAGGSARTALEGGAADVDLTGAPSLGEDGLNQSSSPLQAIARRAESCLEAALLEVERLRNFAAEQEASSPAGGQGDAAVELAAERDRARESAEVLARARERMASLEQEVQLRDHKVALVVQEAEVVRRRCAELAEADKQREQQEERARRLAARCEVLETELARQKERVRTLENQVTSAYQERDQWDQLERDQADLQTLADALMAEGEQLRRALADSRAIEQQRTQELEGVRARAAELEETLRAGREREMTLQWSLTELQGLLAKEQAAANDLRAAASGQLGRHAELEQALAGAHHREVALDTRLREDTKRHAAQVEKLTARCRKLESQYARLKENYAAERADLAARVDTVQSRLSETEAERTRLQGQVAGLTELKEGLEHERERWRHRIGAPPAPRKVNRQTNGAASRAPAAIALSAIAADELAIVAVGASTGGPAALGDMIAGLPADLPACILVVQHMPPGYTADLAYCLDQQSPLGVKEARHGEQLRPGAVLIAPGGHHMEVREGRIRLTAGPRVNMQRPSADVLFDSLATDAKRVCVLLLSGMGRDGVAGMARLRAAGAETLVQDEASSAVWGMPGAAVQSGCVMEQLSPSELARFLTRRLMPQADDALDVEVPASVEQRVSRVAG